MAEPRYDIDSGGDCDSCGGFTIRWNIDDEAHECEECARPPVPEEAMSLSEAIGTLADFHRATAPVPEERLAIPVRHDNRSGTLPVPEDTQQWANELAESLIDAPEFEEAEYDPVPEEQE